jgi:hypothetical protein
VFLGKYEVWFASTGSRSSSESLAEISSTLFSSSLNFTVFPPAPVLLVWSLLGEKAESASSLDWEIGPADFVSPKPISFVFVSMLLATEEESFGLFCKRGLFSGLTNIAPSTTLSRLAFSA